MKSLAARWGAKRRFETILCIWSFVFFRYDLFLQFIYVRVFVYGFALALTVST